VKAFTLAAVRSSSFQITSTLALLGCLALAGCRRHDFPDVPSGYREFAYITDGARNTVNVLDLVYLRQDRVLRVGHNPTGVSVNPKKNEVYVVNTADGTVTVIDAETNTIASTIGVHSKPYAISVDANGQFAYVANSGSNSVSVIDLEKHREVAVAGTGEAPGLARVSPDLRSLVVTNRMSGSISIYALDPQAGDPARKDERFPAPKLRASFAGCPEATDAVILPDSSKVFVACSGGHQVMSIALAVAAHSDAAKQDASSQMDRLLARLDVGKTPVHLALKPDGGEIFVSNFGSDSITEIATGDNEVGGTYMIGSKPVRGVVSADNTTLWVSNFGADSVSLYSIDDGKRAGSIRTGAAPDALAFSAEGHVLLVVDSKAGDTAVVRTQGRDGPGLFTMLPAGNQPNAIVVKAFRVK
jgi:YVTN family beta-propeller protein